MPFVRCLGMHVYIGCIVSGLHDIFIISQNNPFNLFSFSSKKLNLFVKQIHKC